MRLHLGLASLVKCSVKFLHMDDADVLPREPVLKWVVFTCDPCRAVYDETETRSPDGVTIHVYHRVLSWFDLRVHLWSL